MGKFQEDYKNYLYHSGLITEDELIHYGIPGMKWGVRRAQLRNFTSTMGSRIGSRISSKARNLRIAAGMTGRSLFSGAGNRVRNLASRAGSRISSKARSLRIAAGMTGRSLFSGAGNRIKDFASRTASRAGSKIRNTATAAGMQVRTILSNLRKRRASGNPGTALIVRR